MTETGAKEHPSVRAIHDVASDAFAVAAIVFAYLGWWLAFGYCSVLMVLHTIKWAKQ